MGDIIGHNIITQKTENLAVTRKTVKTTKKQKQKSRRQRQNFETDITTEEENSEDIEYDSDNNAAVAGADEADSVGENEDTSRELQGLQDVQQVN